MASLDHQSKAATSAPPAQDTSNISTATSTAQEHIDVLLATCTLFPSGEASGQHLITALQRRGLTSLWHPWTSPLPPCTIIAARSTWDYTSLLPQFLHWSSLHGTSLLNSAAFAWNVDKGYLSSLSAAGIPTVPTVRCGTVEEVRAALAALEGRAVVKPATGVNGFDVHLVPLPAADFVPTGGGRGWVVQPFVEAVRTEGEKSVFVIDGRVTLQLRKRPPPASQATSTFPDEAEEQGERSEEFRVNEDWGGSTVPEDIDPVDAETALQAVRAAERLTGAELCYARVDLLCWKGKWVVSEVELVEPGLYLDVVPGHAEDFADMLLRKVEERRREIARGE